MAETFSTTDGARIVSDLIEAIAANYSYLSEIDGAIGDGDHGINMNKGFGMAGEELGKNPGDLAHSLKTLSRVLMTNIGGSMGPLYGMFFRSAAKTVDGIQEVDAAAFGEMLEAIVAGIGKVSQAKVGDKTMMDALIPAVEAYNEKIRDSAGFSESLDAMVEAANAGRDSTKDMIAKVGRSSRLGERSRGVLDAGATSCALILQTMAGSIKNLLN
jgi:dihydroxyacetone kinase-like protein